MSLPKLISSRPPRSSINDENTSYNYQDSQATESQYIHEKYVYQREGIKDICDEIVCKADEPKEQINEMVEETLEEEAMKGKYVAEQSMFSKPICKGEDFHRALSFQELECGEPARSQHLRIDFTPIEGVDDNEYTINKCHDFWAFIEKIPGLKGLQAMPIVYDENEVENTKKASLSDAIEPTAIDWLKRDELLSKAFATENKRRYCGEGSGDYCVNWLTKRGGKRSNARSRVTAARDGASSRRSVGPSGPAKLPSSDEVKILCKQLEDWDLTHPKSCWDYIVIGGGTSGAVVASRLAEDCRIKVLLIEAGPNFPLESGLASNLIFNHRSNHDWNYTSVNDGYTQQCQRGGIFSPTLGKVLGGSSSTDFMLYSQGDPCDYDEWAAITNEPSWKSKNVQRLFKKVESFKDDNLYYSKDAIYHGFNGSVGLTKDYRSVINKYLNSFKDVGYKVVPDINMCNRHGYTRAVYYIANEVRKNSANAYLYPIRNCKNLVVIKSTQVTKILFDKNKKAIGVIAVSLNTNKTLIFKVKKEIIVAAGTFNTPKLLQLSGVGPKKMLKKFHIKVIADLPVGENYQNHVAAVVNYRTKKICKPYIPEEHDPHDFPTATFFGYAALNKSQEAPDYCSVNFVIDWTPDNIVTLQFLGFFYGFDSKIADSLYKQTLGYELVCTLVQALKPKSKGTVKLRSKNPFDPPVINTGYFSEDEDLVKMIKYVKDYARVGESKYYKKIGAAMIDPTDGRCGKMDPNSDEYWRCYILCMMAPTSHHSGTAAMGAVVDGRLCVIGVQGLRVVDASIMPTPIRGATTIPTMMIGENAAEMIKKDANKECVSRNAKMTRIRG